MMWRRSTLKRLAWQHGNHQMVACFLSSWFLGWPSKKRYGRILETNCNNLLYMMCVFCSWFKRSSKKKGTSIFPPALTSLESTQVPLTDSEWAGLPSTRANYVSFSQQLPNPLLEGRNRNATRDDDVKGFSDFPPKRCDCLWDSAFFQVLAGWWNVVDFVLIGRESILGAFWKLESFCFCWGWKVIDHLIPLNEIGIIWLTIHQSNRQWGAIIIVSLQPSTKHVWPHSGGSFLVVCPKSKRIIYNPAMHSKNP